MAIAEKLYQKSSPAVNVSFMATNARWLHSFFHLSCQMMLKWHKNNWALDPSNTTLVERFRPLGHHEIVGFSVFHSEEEYLVRGKGSLVDVDVCPLTGGWPFAWHKVIQICGLTKVLSFLTAKRNTLNCSTLQFPKWGLQSSHTEKWHRSPLPLHHAQLKSSFPFRWLLRNCLATTTTLNFHSVLGNWMTR